MANSPAFSIVIPTFNRADFIERAVDSCLRQSFPDFEVIVVDDGSTDQTRSVIETIKDSRLRYFRKENGERGAARNFGTHHSRGRYVVFFDSDDILYDNYLSAASRAIGERAPAVVHFDYHVRGTDGRLLQSVRARGRPQTDLLDGNYLACMTVFLRRDVALGNPFNEDRRMAALEDWELWLRLAARHTFVGAPDIVAAVTQHAGRSVVSSDNERIKVKVRVFIEAALSDLRNQEFFGDNLIRVAASSNTYAALHLALNKAPHSEVLRYLALGIRQNWRQGPTRRTFAILRRILLP